MTTLAQKIQKYETVKRGDCRDCGNPWWFSEEHSYVCTTCGKMHGRSTGDEYVPTCPLPGCTEKDEGCNGCPDYESPNPTKPDRCQACEFYGSECVVCKDKRAPGWDMYPCNCRVCKGPEATAPNPTKPDI